ncbi:MAG TPA: archaeal heat shock protein Hsp20 [Nitrososphaerales archaeon]|nr:archaeal heat shock protein Hsp20 [Nitrososphaerales archaeon]
MSFGNPWRGRGGTSRRRKPTDRNGDEERDDAGEWSLDDPFDFDFRFGFGNIDEMIDRMFRAARETAGEMNTFGPVYYGYSITTGPDGKPHVREFGNVKPTRRGTFELGAREPFIDTVVDEKENKLKIVAEMPGVQREDIKLEVLEDSMNIRAEHGDRKYEATVPIQVQVDPTTATATYNNGVLEVSMKLKEQPKRKGVNVRVD